MTRVFNMFDLKFDLNYYFYMKIYILVSMIHYAK